jgi:hypothetical protein
MKYSLDQTRQLTFANTPKMHFHASGIRQSKQREYKA